MGFKNTIGTVGQKLIEYSVYNSPTQIALQAIGQSNNIRGPMGQPQIPAQGCWPQITLGLEVRCRVFEALSRTARSRSSTAIQISEGYSRLLW